MKIHAKITLENGLITKKLISDSRVYELLAILNYLFAPDFYIVFQMSQLTRPFFVLLFDFYAPYTYHGFSSDLP